MKTGTPGAAAAGVPCRLAVETRFLGTDPVSQKQTFWGQGPTVLSRALAGVDAALIQALRDNFGAHTYARVDREGTFHTLWAGDRSEVGS